MPDFVQEETETGLAWTFKIRINLFLAGLGTSQEKKHFDIGIDISEYF
jgi:hypothetical protein